MSGISEKEILNNIKQSVENVLPDMWGKIQNTEECKYEFTEKPQKSKTRRPLRIAAAAAVCVIIALAGLQIKLHGWSDEFASDKGGHNTGKEILTPGTPEVATGRDDKMGDAVMIKPFTKDADAKEASKALNVNIFMPTWLPDGFKKATSKLLSTTEDFSQPYMYSIEYNSTEKKVLTISVTKYMTEDEKIKAQPAPMPAPGVKEPSGTGNKNNATEPEETIPVPPDAVPETKPGYNPSEPAAPPANAGNPSDTPAAADTPLVIDGGGSSGSTGTAVSGTSVSVDFTNIKVNKTQVSISVTSSKETSSVSAFWVYDGGCYNIYSSGISKDDIINIIKSMIS